jgi:heavy metal sensor kinase
VIKHRGTSIRFRLAASYTAVLALTFALIGVCVWVALEHSIQETADRELRSRLADIRRYIDGFSAADLLHQEAEFREESLLGQATANVRISDTSGKWLFRTPGTEGWPPMAAEDNPRTVRVGREVLRVLMARVRVGFVQIGLPIDAFEEVKNGFLWSIGLGSPFLLLLAGFGGYWMSGRALRPVDEISNTAARISAQELSTRLPTSGVGDELDRLSGILNAMLTRLESAFKRITEFTADASHELRTPVAIIQTTSELMQTRSRTVHEHVEAWGLVRAETERISRLIADLLTLARLDAGKADFEFRPMDLSEAVRTAGEEMRVMADAKELVLSVHAATPCPIHGDLEALRRATCILLDNAIKFTHSGGIRLEVNVQGRAEVTVSDTGVGIGQEDIPFIFERFYRVSKDRSRKTGGTGLGLSIARLIVERHGGELRVESAPSKGSTFTMLLPAS